MTENTNRHEVTNPRFFWAGNAIFTVAGPTCHYTFRVRQPKPEMPHFVDVLTGPDNTRCWTYVGVLIPDGSVRTTRASRYRQDSTPVRVATWGMRMVVRGRRMPECYAVLHEGRCGRCGRRLTVPESIRTGFGPECASAMGIGPC